MAFRQSSTKPEEQIETIVARDKSKDITSPFQVKNLPSNFLPYPNNSRVVCDTYTYGEIKKINDSKLPLDIQYEIILSGVHTEGFNKHDLTFFDFLYVGILRNLSSLPGTKFSISYYCPKCKDIRTEVLPLDVITFDDLTVPSLPLYVDFLTIEKHSFLPFTIGNFIYLYRNDLLYLKDAKGEIIYSEDGSPVRDQMALIAVQCTSMDFKTAYKTFSELREQGDMQFLEMIDPMFDHGLKRVKIVCNTRIGDPPISDRGNTNNPPFNSGAIDTRPICGEEIYEDLVGGESIIRPFREDRGTFRDRIYFGQEGSD